jgi:hypothetical protein
MKPAAGRGVNLKEWHCATRETKGGSVTEAYYHNNKVVLESAIPQEVRKAHAEGRLECREERFVAAGPEAVLPGKESPKTAAARLKCVRSGGDGTEYFYRGSQRRVDASEIPRQVRNLITCEVSAQAYHSPESIGKTRSQTVALYECKGKGLLGRATTVSGEEQRAAEERKGKRCSPKKR